MHVDGLIPLISAIVQQIAVLCSLRTCTSFSSYSAVNLLEIITGNVPSSPRNTYLRGLERCFKYGMEVVISKHLEKENEELALSTDL